VDFYGQSQMTSKSASYITIISANILVYMTQVKKLKLQFPVPGSSACQFLIGPMFV